MPPSLVSSHAYLPASSVAPVLPVSEVLIADDHPLFRDALQRAVLSALPQAKVHAADSVHSLLALVEQWPEADLLLLDLHMPGARGYSALAHIRGQYPGLPTIVVSGHEEAQVARRALAHGASAYIPKSSAGEDIVQAIRAVLDGDVWLPHHLLGGRMELKADEADVAARVASLTPQQFRVLTMIAEGLLNKQIAYDLAVSEATVKAHMTAIMRKLGVSNRTQVALAASQLAVEPGVLPPMPEDDD
jgi:DNA-binding NarL/FixJ family response regulator